MIEIERNTFVQQALLASLSKKHAGYKELELHNCLGIVQAACTIIRLGEVVLVLIRPSKDADKDNTNFFPLHSQNSQLFPVQVRKEKSFGTEFTF